MLDHFNLPVSDLEQSTAFYQAVLAPLNMTLIMRDGDAVGFGMNTWAFGLVRTVQPVTPIHLAFSALTCEAVREFYAAALKAGGRDNGKPGLRVQYGPAYFAAYNLDPDGHNVEAVCRSEDSLDKIRDSIL